MSVVLHLLYGGTFDPVHAGHVAVAQAVCAAAQPDQFWFVPSALPPHRATPQVSAEQRLCMLELMLAEVREKNWAIDRCEIQRAARGLPSYTVDTLREKLGRENHAQQSHTEASQPRFLWVLGWDALLGLPSWKEPDVLLSLAPLVVLPREGARMPADHPLYTRWQQRQVLDAQSARSAENGRLLWCEMPTHAASATAIRAALQRGERTPEHVSPSVAAYIEREQLYRSAPENNGALSQD